MTEVFCDNKLCIFSIDGKCTSSTIDMERRNEGELEVLMCNSFQAWN